MMTTMYDQRRISAQAFIEKLEELQRENARREIASLKRNAGNTLTEAHGANWFYRLLDHDALHASDSVKDSYFLVATLWTLNPRSSQGNFGHTCHQLWLKKSPGESEKEKVKSAVARRFNILLDADLDSGALAFRLRQFVKLLAAHEVGIDWAQLLLDLHAWRQQEKYVQRQWAESFYAPDFTGETIAPADRVEKADTAKGDSHVD